MKHLAKCQTPAPPLDLYEALQKCGVQDVHKIDFKPLVEAFSDNLKSISESIRVETIKEDCVVVIGFWTRPDAINICGSSPHFYLRFIKEVSEEEWSMAPEGRTPETMGVYARFPDEAFKDYLATEPSQDEN